MTNLKHKLVLAAAAIVVSSVAMSAAVICQTSATPFIVAGGLGIYLSVLASAYIVKSVMETIRARECATEELRETTNRLQTLVDAIPDSIYFKDTAGRHLFVNSACEAALGSGPGSVLGKTADDLLPPDLADSCRRSDAAVVESRRLGCTEEEIRRPDGEIVFFETIKAPIIDDRGTVVGLAGVTRDITERKKAEKALKESEARYKALSSEFRAVLDAFPDNLSLQSPDFRFVWTNAVTAATLGREAGELPGRFCHELWQGRPEPCSPCPVKRCFETGHIEQDVTAMADGTAWEVRAVPIRGEDGSVSRAIELVRDITDIRHLEAQLRHSQKMEAVGRLAGGIAHDINNYIGAITGYCEHLKMTNADNERLVGRMDSVIALSYKASALIKQILAFSRKQPIRLGVTNLNEVVEGMARMMRRLIGENIALELSLAEGIWSVKADPVQMEQVLVNLLVNAKDAMPESGAVSVRTANVAIGDAFQVLHPEAKPGEYVMISMSDTGGGIPPEIRDKVFEPFFTTKESGKGSGLGLSMVYGIVKQHNGYVWVDSEVGRGTTFDVYLPRCREETPAEYRRPAAAGAELGEACRILLVEDNADVREAVGALLRAMGHEVTTSCHGEDALQVIDGGEPGFDLLITDVIMPGMSGQELASRIQDRNPGMKVLFMSGYPDKALVQDGILSDGINFLQKPFAAAVLGKKVRELVGSGAGAP
ncbi:MAG: PAS domain-containing protein [Gemmatimonadota bacterium]